MVTNRTKKFATVAITALSLISSVFAVQVSINPLRSDARFTPAEQLHAGCLNSVNIGFDEEGKQIENVHLVMNYNPQDIQIARVVSEGADKNMVNYNLENDKLVLNYLNANSTKFNDDTIFEIYFKSIESLTSTVISIQTGSYALTTDGKKILLRNQTILSFGKAEECEPDLMPPMISLIAPKDIKKRLPLDVYFVLEIKDLGKGVDKNSIKIDFAGKKYTAMSENIKWNGDYMVFYPSDWLPIDQKLLLEITVNDNQIYGGANVSRKQFKFETATGMVLQNGVAPIAFRKIAKKAENVFGSETECKIIKQIYSEGNVVDKFVLKNVLEKLNCDTTDLALYTNQNNNTNVQAGGMINVNQNENKLSVLAVVGWALFLIVLFLKINYYIDLSKHKRAHKKYKKIVEDNNLVQTNS